MSTERYIVGSVRIDGVKVCKVCHVSLPARRREYCSEECADRNDPGMMRRKVFRRDQGVCSMCGLDTCAIIDPPSKHVWVYAANHKWEADHIVPVSEGGGLCGIDGYRTLCKGSGTNNCHGKVSGELRKRLNERKRLEKIQRETGMLFEAAT